MIDREMLALVWAVIIILGVIMYVILDGFDLGLGILFPFAPSNRDRDIVMASVAPVWDGNETWLILGGAALFGAFPVAYATLLPALYLPIGLFLFALVFRGVAFEFRHKAYRSQFVWNASFNIGSTLAAFCQGLVLGSFIQGFRVEDMQYAGGLWDWVTPFSFVVGIALVAGYALLGACWLIIKTEGDLQDWAYARAKQMFLAVLFFIAVVSIWTPFMDPQIRLRWLTWPNIGYLAPIPVVTAAVGFALWRSLQKRREKLPFLLAIGLFALSFLGLGISLWPYIIPFEVTIYEAASQSSSQIFLLVGTIIILPIILAYTAYAYRVFRGKARLDSGYH